MEKAGSGTRLNRSMALETNTKRCPHPLRVVCAGVRKQYTTTHRQPPCTGQLMTAMVPTQVADMQQWQGLRSSQADTCRHTQGQMALYFLTCQDPGPLALPHPDHDRRPAWGDCSRANPLPHPHSSGASSGPKAPRSHAEQTWAARHSTWTVRGMGWACSLTQPALGTTAQLDRAATCRWAGESNEREC